MIRPMTLPSIRMMTSKSSKLFMPDGRFNTRRSKSPLIVSLPLSPPALAALVSPDALLLKVPRTPACETRYDPRAEQPKCESD
jgi:hypothetical protein